ncbi:conjugative transposon protein TraM [Pedobacter frigidisoli]|uniref:conjugative transposon protein TraM n=1 Tax=Pedobacter frigidisoli TaxID=2530455 RepID=UPI00292EF538|nr:conjugative transposon protein TraM [Pedobacter frigidisoli]
MKINFKQPRYILPLLALPFLCLFFYVYSNSSAKESTEVPADGMNGQIADISDQVRDRGLSGKLDAYRDRYKASDGYSGINPISEEVIRDTVLRSGYSDAEKRSLDSIAISLKPGNSGYRIRNDPATGYARVSASVGRQSPLSRSSDHASVMSDQDKQMAKALADLASARKSVDRVEQKDRLSVQVAADPMDVFRKQMSYMDSISKQNDPAFQEEHRKQLESLRLKKLQESADRNSLRVKPSGYGSDKTSLQIKALIDQDVTALAGSRIRIRLLEDMQVGEVLVPGGSFLYAMVVGFSDQRIRLSISSVYYAGKILPVKLEIYDLDGLAGLYVPASFFREFSKNIGGESIQGVSVSSASGQQFLMSTVDRLFQSTSSAISGLIKKNRAKIKYSTHVLLIDTAGMQ